MSLSSTKYVYKDTDSVIDDWEELYVPSSTTYEQLKEIMDDALTNGFEFEVNVTVAGEGFGSYTYKQTISISFIPA